MKTIHKLLLGAAAILGVLCISVPAFASSLPVGVSQFYLAGAGVTAVANTVQLTSMQTPDGRPITMSMFGTTGYGAIDPQTTAKIEDITFTGITQNLNGTATLTGVTRGNDFVYPYASTGSLQKSHSGGATFIITNTAGFYYNEFTMNNNNNLFTWPAASTSPATRGYVDFVAFNGAAVINASTINKGVVQIATGAQAAATTVNGSTGSQLVLPAAIATSTYNAATSVNVIPVTGAGGKIDPNFFGSLSSTTVIGSTFAFDIGKHEQLITASSSWAIPNGIRTVYARIVGAGGNSAGNTSCSASGGSGGYSEGMIDVSATTSLAIVIGAQGTATTSTDISTTGFTGPYQQIATAGSAGAGASSNPCGTTGGAGGIGIGGTATSTGATGGSSFATTQAIYGPGGMSVLGSYGKGGDGGQGSVISGNPGVVIIYY